MARPPLVVGLLLCERFSVSAQAGASLEGLFNGLYFRDFPSLPREFTAYACLYRASGEGTIELLVTDAQTERDIYRYQSWATFPSPSPPVHTVIPVRCVFPAPGAFNLTLRFDERILAQRTLLIYQE